MKDLFWGLVFVAVGVLTVLFRHKFRFDGPAGVAPLFDKSPTSKTEQAIVAAFGVIIFLGGCYIVFRFVSSQF